LKKRATITQIADALSLSVSTVSRILNGKGEFSESTKKSVLEVAKLLDYRANTLAVSLRKNLPSKVVGVILPHVNHYFFSNILDGIISNSHNQGYMVMIGESLDQYDIEKELIDNFSDHYVAGIILAPTQNEQSEQNVLKMTSQEIPHVVIDRTYENRNSSYVKHDDFNGARQAVTHLINQGYQKIALLQGPEACIISKTRTKGYRAALNENNMKWHDDLEHGSEIITKEAGYEIFKSLYNRHQPDAVFAITDIQASGIFKYAIEHGIRIPEDLGIVGYSNSDICEVLYPQMSSVNQNGFEMGKTALSYLFEKIGTPESNHQMTFESELIIRGSSVRS